MTAAPVTPVASRPSDHTQRDFFFSWPTTEPKATAYIQHKRNFCETQWHEEAVPFQISTKRLSVFGSFYSLLHHDRGDHGGPVSGGVGT